MDITKYKAISGEQPLDNIVVGGGFCSILRQVICIGDSLASGEFELVHDDGSRSYHDMYEYSWGQFMAREAGIKVYNYSRGGMTAKEYCETFADSKGFWNDGIKPNAYIIALGVNDVNTDIDLGDITDIDLDNYRNNKKTFVGYYAQIIQRYKQISKDAKFFFITPPYLPDCKADTYKKIAELLNDFTRIFANSYLIDLQKYGPDYADKEFRDCFYLNNHLTATGYKLTAEMIMSYIDYIIRNNPDDFKMNWQI